MSSIFDKLDQAKAQSSWGNLAPQENFVLRVSGYDTTGNPHMVIGNRADTGAPVKVFLRGEVKNRPGVAEFETDVGAYAEFLAPYERRIRAAEARIEQKAGDPEQLESALKKAMRERSNALAGIKCLTEPGGSMVVDGAFFDKKVGAVSAKWITRAGGYEGAPEKIIPRAMVRINPLQVKESDDGTKNYQQSITIANLDAAKSATSVADLKGLVAGAFEQGNGAAVLVRVSDGSQVRVIESELRGVKKTDDGQYVPRTVSEMTERFMNSPTGVVLKQFVEDPSLGATIEVLPISCMNMARETLKAMIDKGRIDSFDQKYRLPNGCNGFTESLVVYRDNKGMGAPLFQLVKPVSQTAEVVPAEALRTKNITVPMPALTRVGRPEMEDTGVDIQADLPVDTDLSLSDDFDDIQYALLDVDQSPQRVQRSRGQGLPSL